MFVELMPLLKERTLLITVARVDEKVKVNVIPAKVKEGEDQALTTPLTFTGSAEELDAELGRHLASYVDSHLALGSTLAEAKAEMDAAAKAACQKVALLAYGHPEGIHVTLRDPDVISPTNCVRQPFSQSEIGLYKSVVLANRSNLFWGLDWQGIPERLDTKRRLDGVDIVIGCVDSRKARAAIAKCAEDWSEVDYWLDLGNNADSGQVVLGEPLNRRNRRHRLRLRTVSELFPEVVQSELDGDGIPSCSAAEALDRQEPFVNPTLANHALALLARLFRYGTASYHGAFVSLSYVGGVQPLRVDSKCWQRLRKRNRQTLNTPTRKDWSNGTNAAEQ